MATITGTFATATPRLNWEGLTVARGLYQASGATVSVSDTYLAVKVPNGATIVDGYIGGTVGTAATVFKVGTIGANQADNACGSTMTLSATAQLVRFNSAQLPYRVSLSDDAVPQWAWVGITVNSSVSVCATASINLVVTYAANGAI